MNNFKFEGLPGTGKTTKLIKILHQTHKNDMKNTLICTFQAKMAQDVRDRLGSNGNDRHDLYNVATIHAECKRLAGIEQVITQAELKLFAESFGVAYKANGSFIDPMDMTKKAPGNVLYDLYGWMKNNLCHDISEYPNQWRLPRTVDHEAFIEEYDQYKQENDKKDFSDMLSDVIEYELCPDCNTLMVDEFQDLTPAQYAIFKMWAKGCDNVYIAGDPYQTLFPFFGSSPDFFNGWSGDLEILPETKRFGVNTWEFAKSLLENAGYEDIPEIKATGKTSDVKELDSYEYLETAIPNFTSNTFHLVRCHYMAYKIANRLADNGVPFHGDHGWKEEEINAYNGLFSLKTEGKINRLSLQTLINIYPDGFFKFSKEKLTEIINKIGHVSFDLNDISKFAPQQNTLAGTNFIKSITDKIPLSEAEISDYNKMKIINALEQYNKPISKLTVYLGTIHSVKGMEADNVFVWNELSPIAHKTLTTTEGAQSESRVWFVAATRAKQNLFWVNSNTRYKYEV